jgi:hypothetical protein
MPNTLRVLVTGDRNWTDKDAIRCELAQLPADTLIIHGACRGADLLAQEVAQELGLPDLPFPVDWDQARRDLGHRWRAAGPIRNRKMLVEGRPHRALAFHRDLKSSRGTLDMVVQLLLADVPCKLIDGKSR